MGTVAAPLYAGGAMVEGQLTGVHRHESLSYPPNLRFKDGVLQQQWDCGENDYDNETSRTWKEWRDVPSVESDDESNGD